MEWAGEVGLKASGFNGSPTFCPGGRAVSAIDHSMYGGAIGGFWPMVVGDGEWCCLSDHRPLLVDVDIPGLGGQYRPAKRRPVMAGYPVVSGDKQIELYQKRCWAKLCVGTVECPIIVRFFRTLTIIRKN